MSANNSKDNTCSLVFLRRGDEILLAMKKRGFGSDRWNGIGGKQDSGETIEQTMIREAIEEVNVVPRRWHKIAVHDFIIDADTPQPWHMHTHVYFCDEWDGDPVETEEMAPRWFKLADIPYQEMWHDDIIWLPLALSGQALIARFSFKQDETVLTANLQLVEQAPSHNLTETDLQ